MARPKHNPKPDENHRIVRDAAEAVGYVYCGLPLKLIDTSKHGGELCDWLVWLGPLLIVMEVKQPGKENELTSGERTFFETARGPRAIVMTEQDVFDVLHAHADMAYALNEMVEKLGIKYY